jgi:hypothetical protein
MSATTPMRTSGTKTFSNFVTKRWVGDLSVCTSATNCTMRARELSLASLDTSTRSRPSPFTVPAKTSDSAALSHEPAREQKHSRDRTHDQFAVLDEGQLQRKPFSH